MPRDLAPARRPAALGVLAAAVLAVAGCSGGADAPSSGSGAGPVPVSAGFYPLEYAVARVGAGHVAVTTLTEPGVEPHDLELTSPDVAALGSARLVVYLRGFQPAVDTAVDQRAGATGFDVREAAHLDLAGTPGDDAGPDPHFWLDPTRVAAVGQAVAERLAQVDPDHAADYRANAVSFAAELTTLDTAFREGLAACANRHLVTSHAAFGYLARRYGFTQVPITGITPEQEPSARQLADVAATVRDTKANTVYAETLVDAKYAETVARSTGARVAVLDPVEGVTATSAGSDYPAIMRANLSALRVGQGCS